MRKSFQPMSREGEIALLRADDRTFTRTREYLEPLISDALQLFSFAEPTFYQIRSELREAIPVAAARFLANPKNLSAGYKFSTYFTWYISEGIDRHFHIRRAA